MRKLLVDIQRTAALVAIRDMRHLLARVAEALGIPTEMSSRMTLALAETLTNVVEHTSPSASIMSMRVELSDGNWSITVSDDGGQWTSDEATAGLPEDDSGRGLAIVQACCDAVTYRRDDDTQRKEVVLTWHAADDPAKSRVMIVEDDATQRALYQAYLQSHYELILVDSGQAALDAFTSVHPDLVLSDLKMPGMDGLSFRERLIENNEGALTAFIVLTGNEDQGVAQHAISLGVDDYLQKPVNGAQLRRAIERVLNRNRQLRQRLGQRIASRITSSLVSGLPEHIPGWQHALAVRDTGTGGGDLLLHRTVGDRAHLLLVDVMGHVETAKFFAHACAGYLRGLLHGLAGDVTPAQLLTALSAAALEDQLMTHTLFTCLALTLHRDGQVGTAIAGHPPPLRINGSNIGEAGDAEMVPGLQAGLEYREQVVQLAHGERLALYTDGLFENAHTSLEREQLTETIRHTLSATAGSPPSRALRDIMQRFDAKAPTPLRDDTKSEDLEIERVETGAEARKAIIVRPPDVVLLDIVLPDEDGLEILRWIHAEGIPSGVVVMTAHSSVEIAVDAMRFGAADFLEKPFDGARLKTTVRNVLERTRLESFVAELKDTFERDSYQGFIGASLPMQAVHRIIDAAAPSKATVFITGESGTGKEVCAEAIHAKGPRAKKPFIAINCGAIPHDLMESEIFGHVKGAFTGAASDRAGAARRAKGGTLFLDEIGEVSMDLQNVIRNITVLHDDTEVRVEHLPPPVDTVVGNIEFTTTRLQQVDDTTSTQIEAGEQGVKPLAQVERDAIEHAIAVAEGNIPKAAALLQVSPSTLYRKKQAWDADEAV